MGKFALAFLLLGTALNTAADSPWDDDPYERALAVNEGALHFLAEKPARPVHHHVNRLFFTDQSRTSGWLRMEQCHYDIDPVPAAEIVFTPGRIRDLEVVSATGIGKARAEAHSVQLEDIGHDAVLCIRGETLALGRTGDTLVVRSGPFMRRFLDGYYPMRVTLELNYPGELVPVDQFPLPQPGVTVDRAAGRITVDAWFEGILETRFRFRDPRQP